MKQIIQSYKTGKIELCEVPMPLVKAGGVLVRNVNSLISIGTERMMIDTAKKSLMGKALARPDLVKQVFDKAKKEGFLSVFNEAMARLDEPVPLGYTSTGVVEKVGAGVTQFKPGDRVACAGAGFASHAEYVWVPENMTVKIPEGVTFEEAAFVMLGGIALHGIRSANLTFGESVAVVGLGLLGLISVQILNAYSCRVIGIDIDSEKVALAKTLGASQGFVIGQDDVKSLTLNHTGGVGADAVIITASTKDNSPIQLAEDITRKRGRVVLVGVTELSLSRKAFWEKELGFTVSKAAGPGSLEKSYEEKGQDYPFEHVRWTQKRNLGHFLDLIAQKRVKLEQLITHRFSIDEALAAYDRIIHPKEAFIGVLLRYADRDTAVQGESASARVVMKDTPAAKGTQRISVIGGGLFTKNILLPVLKKIPGITFQGIATTRGVTSHHLARKMGFRYCTSRADEILKDTQTDTVLIVTRHDLHARMVTEALQARKRVFVEKPLCVREEELRELAALFRASGAVPQLMVGFNRRFSPLAREVKAKLVSRSVPLNMHIRVNAGFVPADHWIQDPQTGGGRVMGEMCHFIDLMQYFSDSEPVSVFANGIGGATGRYGKEDNVSVHVEFQDGSIGTLLYSAQGSKAFSRERVEIFNQECVYVIDDFKSAVFVEGGRRKDVKRLGQDMGYASEMKAFVDGSAWTDAGRLDGVVATTLATFKILQSLREKRPVPVHVEEWLKESSA